MKNYIIQLKWGLALLLSLNVLNSNSQSLKLMTYNIRLELESDELNDWNHRKEKLTGLIRFYEPDIFGVQEATPNQGRDLGTLLTNYSFVGIGRDGLGKGESSNIYYKNERFVIKKSKTFWLSETPDTISKGWDAAYNRICTYALFKDLITKKEFWVFNTHLDHIGVEARTKGIQLILSVIEKLNEKKYPVIFMGDFNSESDSERIIELRKAMDDCRAFSEEKPYGPSGTFNGFKFNEPFTTLIDYIFISKNNNMKVKKYAILSDSNDLTYPSDHFPVYVEIRY